MSVTSSSRQPFVPIAEVDVQVRGRRTVPIDAVIEVSAARGLELDTCHYAIMVLRIIDVEESVRDPRDRIEDLIRLFLGDRRIYTEVLLSVVCYRAQGCGPF